MHRTQLVADDRSIAKQMHGSLALCYALSFHLSFSVKHSVVNHAPYLYSVAAAVSLLTNIRFTMPYRKNDL